MERFDLNILGCGSASPTSRHYPSSQVINQNERLFMIDCGEGTQMQLRTMKLKFARLNHILLSHLHGDHCFGLIGLLSTLALLGRTADLFVFAHPDAETIFTPLLNYFCKDLSFKVKFIGFNPQSSELLFQDKGVSISTIPLKHRIPTAGFMIEEKPRFRHIIREMIDFYQIPVAKITSIKQGEDYFDPMSEQLIPNGQLTQEAAKPIKYAYCSDTVYTEKIIPLIEGADLLYHEATFASDNLTKAKITFHSTARQAATIAQKANVKQLVIGHFSARYTDEQILLNEAKEVFENTLLAKDGMKITMR